MNAAWDDLTAAVSQGLVDHKEKALADVVPILAKKPASATWRPATMEQVPADRPRLRLRLRESQPPLTVIDYEFRFCVDYDALTSLETGRIAKWAAAARSFELFDVLNRLAAKGHKLDSDIEGLRAAVPNGGWGEVRCVTFKLERAAVTLLDSIKQFGWDGPVVLAERLRDEPEADCLLFRKGGGPHVRRSAGLTLGWLPVGGGVIDLVLAEQFEIVNAQPDTVVAIRLRR